MGNGNLQELCEMIIDESGMEKIASQKVIIPDLQLLGWNYTEMSVLNI